MERWRKGNKDRKNGEKETLTEKREGKGGEKKRKGEGEGRATETDKNCKTALNKQDGEEKTRSGKETKRKK